LDRLNRLVEGLRVLPKNIDRNLKKTQGIYFSGHVLLALVQKGVSREQAYQITQTAAHRAWDNEEWFGHELWKEALIQEKFSRKELDEILNVKNYLRFVDRIFDRVV
jgi:adenylosuccinate lyase